MAEPPRGGRGQRLSVAVRPRTVEAVVLDIGETLVDETRAWACAAQQAGVTALTLFAALGSLIERGRDHREVWDLLGVAPPADRVPLEPGDLYPDALPALEALRAAGYRLGLAGNQPASASAELLGLGVPVQFAAASEEWGVEKPSPEFFAAVARAAEAPADRIAYVGDRLDNDVLPAQAVGMLAVLVVRGPWGHLHRRSAQAARADAVIDDLRLLPRVLGRLSGRS